MNRIEIAVENIPLSDDTENLISFMQNVLRFLEHDNWDLSVLFCNDEFIRLLNRRYRKKDEATDVLSFPLGETIVENGDKRYAAGDIVISLDTLAENAAYFGIEKNEELRRLLVHGILHLGGMDHQTNDPQEAMLQKQEQILHKIDKI